MVGGPSLAVDSSGHRLLRLGPTRALCRQVGPKEGTRWKSGTAPQR